MSFEYLNELNKQQREAATYIEGPLRIIAGAGSGKTKTLITRVAYMVDKGINPEHILLITFTNNAANEMLSRASKLSNPECQNITACTIHSWCAKILREYGQYVGLPKDFVILAPSEEIDAINLIETQFKYRNMRGFPPGKVLSSLFSEEVNKGIPYETLLEYGYCDWEQYTSEIGAVKNNYQNYRNGNKLLNYDDLLVKTYELLENNEKIREAVSYMYQYVMVDEYQDTNHLQEQIIMLLCQKYKNLAVVGDDYQSIYAFRGADVSNLVDFPKRLPTGTNCKTVILKTNYRSTDQIVELSNSVMDNCADFGVKKQMESFRGEGKQDVIRYVFENEKEEAAFLAKQIAGSIRNGEDPEEIAVLGRNGNSSNILESILNRMHISYQKLGGIKFLDHECVQNVLALCKISCNPYNELGWYRALDMIPNIGDVWSNRIIADLGTDSFMEREEYQSKSFYPYFKALNHLLEKVRNEADLNNQITIIINYYVHLREHIIKQMKTDEVNRDAQLALLEAEKEVLETLTVIASQYNTMLQFLDAILLDATKSEDDEKMITISTVHSSKGLEWNDVYLLDCVYGVYPNPTLDQTQFEIDESLRCFYVAITRAKNRLFISTPKEIKNKEMKRTPFLDGSKDKYKKEKVNGEPKKKIYLSVPYALKEEAKALGAKWDAVKKSWYCFNTDKNCDELVRTY